MSLLPTIGAVDQDTGFYNGVATQSLRFEDGDSAYLHRTPSASNRRTWTYSCWYKKGNQTTTQNQAFFAAGNSSTDFTMLYIDGTTDDLRWYDYDGSTDYGKAYGILLRDNSSWYHIVYAFDTTQSTDANKVKVYVNGTQQTVIGTDYGWMPTDYQTKINDAKQHTIAKYTGNNQYIDGYLAEINFVDGTQLTADSFGETKNGVWIPKAYTGSYGTNGFHLEFKETGDGSSTASSTTIGADTANSNHFKDVNLDSYDSNMPDSPENNFPTWNTNAPDNTYSITTISQGSLKSLNSAGSNLYSEITFQLDQTNKYYFEYYNVVATTPVKPASFELFASSTNKFSLYITNAGNIYVDGSSIGSSFPVLGTGDIVNIAYDGASGKIWLGHNGTYYNASGSATGNPADGSNPIATLTSAEFKMTSVFYQQGAIMNFGQDSTFAGNKTSGSENAQDSNGIGDFYDTVPSGFLALCSANLPEPTIGPNSGTDEQADDYFNTVLFTGNSSTKAVTGLGFKPDWFWGKSRTNPSGAYSHSVYDSSRGVTKRLLPDLTNAESTTSGITSFDADGFTLGSNGGNNLNNATYVNWCWKANGGTTSTNEVGSITSTVQANTTSGFSIVTWSGNETDGATIGHGLSSGLQMIITKCRSHATSWVVGIGGISGLGVNDYLTLQSTSAKASLTNFYQSYTSDSNTTFQVGVSSADEMNRNTGGTARTYVSYCFHSVEGYSKMGGYTGNGLANGTFVFTGFRPAFVMVKRTDAANNWMLSDSARDTDNVINNLLYANLTNAEYALAHIDFTSNGFKLRTSNASWNASSGTYIYMAFAEAPFKYANAR